MDGSRKLLFVGWDAADWQIIDPLIEQGKMPHLAELIRGGVRGNLASLQPMLSPMLWTSIATGKRPYKHGIHGFIEPLPDRSGVRPVTSTSRTSRAIWNILTSKGMHSNTVGWFASHPAEPAKGVTVSNMFQRGCPRDKAWKVPEHSVHPPELAEALGKLRVHEEDLLPTDLAPFIPTLAGQTIEDKVIAKGVASLAKLLAEMATIQSVSTALLEQEPWDASFIYFDSIDHFCHAFMPQRPPKLPQVGQAAYDIFKDTIDGVYMLQDLMLGRALEFCEEDTTVVICSDHGFLNNHLRPVAIPEGPQGPAAWHRFHGMVVMNGPGIRAGEQVYGSTVLDICPTLLTILGLPVGKDMDGKVIATAFETPPEPQSIPSWDDVEGEFGEHTEELRVDPVAAAEAIQQMIDLGYVDELTDDVGDQVETAVRELKTNLAIGLQDGFQYDRSLEIFKELAEQYPDHEKFRLAVAEYALEMGDPTLARAHIDQAIKERDEQMRDGKEVKPSPTLHLQLAQVLLAEHRYNDAMEEFRIVQEMAPNNPRILLRVATAQFKQRDYPNAEQVFQRVIEIDENEPLGYMGIAQIAMRRRDYEAAADNALTAVELRHHLLGGHLLLAKALARLGRLAEAIAAANTVLALRPNFRLAHRYLVRLHRMAGSNALADLHTQRIQAIDAAPA